MSVEDHNSKANKVAVKAGNGKTSQRDGHAIQTLELPALGVKFASFDAIIISKGKKNKRHILMIGNKRDSKSKSNTSILTYNIDLKSYKILPNTTQVSKYFLPQNQISTFNHNLNASANSISKADKKKNINGNNNIDYNGRFNGKEKQKEKSAVNNMNHINRIANIICNQSDIFYKRNNLDFMIEFGSNTSYSGSKQAPTGMRANIYNNKWLFLSGNDIHYQRFSRSKFFIFKLNNKKQYNSNSFKLFKEIDFEDHFPSIDHYGYATDVNYSGHASIVLSHVELTIMGCDHDKDIDTSQKKSILRKVKKNIIKIVLFGGNCVNMVKSFCTITVDLKKLNKRDNDGIRFESSSNKWTSSFQKDVLDKMYFQISDYYGLEFTKFCYQGFSYHLIKHRYLLCIGGTLTQTEIDAMVKSKCNMILYLDLKWMKWHVIENALPFGITQHKSVIDDHNQTIHILGGIDIRTRKWIDIHWRIDLTQIFENWAISWNVQRIIWIAFVKNANNKHCYLATVPKVIIVHILGFLRIQ